VTWITFIEDVDIDRDSICIKSVPYRFRKIAAQYKIHSRFRRNRPDLGDGDIPRLASRDLRMLQSPLTAKENSRGKTTWVTLFRG